MHEELFSSNELLVLIGKYSPSVVLGFKDPVSGFLAGEILEFYEQGLASLTIRGIARIDDEQKLKIYSPVDKWIEVICTPQHSMVVGWNDNNSSELVTFHFLNGYIIELRQVKNGEQASYLLKSRTSDEIFETLIAPFYTNFYIDRSELVGDIPYKMLEKIANLILNNDFISAKQIFLDAGFPDHLSILCLSALTNSAIKFSVTTYYFRNQLGEPKRNSFSIITKDGEIWLVKPAVKETFVSIHLISKTELESYIKSAIPQRE